MARRAETPQACSSALPSCRDDGAVVGDLGGPARPDHGGGLAFLDDGRAGERRSRPQLVPPEQKIRLGIAASMASDFLIGVLEMAVHQVSMAGC